jgi:hypothetical protein
MPTAPSGPSGDPPIVVPARQKQPSRPRARSLAELIAPALDPVLRKRGLARAELLAWWPDIVGEAYAAHTRPERIRWPRDGKAAVLVVRCDPALALQFSYETENVRRRLNSYFGYAAVGAVRIVQHPLTQARPTRQPEAGQSEVPPDVQRRLAGVDGPLKDSLLALGRAIFART